MVGQPVEPEQTGIHASLGRRDGQALGQPCGALLAPQDVLASSEQPQDLGAEDFRHGGARVVAGGEEGVACDRGVALVPDLGAEALLGEREEHPRAFRIVLGPELQRALVVADGRLERAERRGTVARLAQGEPGRPAELGGVGSRRERLQRAHVVVRAQLRVVLRPT